MKKRRYLKFLLVLYTLLLVFLYGLHYGGRRSRESGTSFRSRYPILECSLGTWNLGRGEEQDTENRTQSVVWKNGNDVRLQQKQHIYLHATWRTGSSFLGELFNQHPDVFYLYEPMWHIWQALYPGDAESLQGALRDMVASLFRCDFSVLRLYASEGATGTNLTTASIFGWKTNKVICSAPLCPGAPRRDRVGLVDGTLCQRHCPGRALRDLERECRKYPVVVIKDVRLLDVGVLAPLMRESDLNVKIIQLFRDPRAMHNSRLKSKQRLLRESVQILRSRQKTERFRSLLAKPAGSGQLGRLDFFLSGALEVICDAWLSDLLLVARGAQPWLRGRYIRLRYEDLMLQPRVQLNRLLRFSGLPILPALERFLLNMTHGAGYGSEKPFLVSARDAHLAMNAWRERLSREQVRHVETSCREAMNLLSYRFSEEANLVR